VGVGAFSICKQRVCVPTSVYLRCVETNENQEITQALTVYFALPDGEISYEVLLQKVTEEIQYLIDFNLDKLWSLLYRIDVAEKKVKEVIATTPFTQHARRIAELIIQRQQEKIISRKKYKP
jgi:dihydrodipicolinate reductase